MGDPRGGPGAGPAGLEALARLHGLEPVHRDGFDREVRPSPEVLLAALRALGAPVETASDVSEALRVAREVRGRRGIPPVTPLPAGEPGRIPVGSGAEAGSELDVEVRTEGGEALAWRLPVQELPPDAGGAVALPRELPLGYHRIRATGRERGGAVREEEGLLVAAPRRAYGAAPEGGGSPLREWGAFLPLYALRSARDWGVGDLTDLEALLQWIRGLGGGVAATLPLFAAFLDRPLEPSPYAPASRLFWNELFLDPARLPEWTRSPEARRLAGSLPFRERRTALRESPRVRYLEAARLKREVLELLAEAWRRNGGPESPGFRAYLRRRPEAPRYARFRAALEAGSGPPSRWPAAWRERGIPEDAWRPADRWFHLYVQFRLDEGLEALPGDGAGEGPALYLDLPLGTHPEGFDPWAHPDLFASGASMGAPPDGFHPEGQDWGLPPLRPVASRAGGHAYLRSVLGGLLPRARYLRLDHVMGLHRLYWIPRGAPPREGVYVRYPAEELYAILALESHRHRTVLVGEDLGTVPAGVRETMAERGLLRMHVVPFEIRAEEPGGAAPVPRDAVASLNTHDLPPFAAFWKEGASPAERAAFRRWVGGAEAPRGEAGDGDADPGEVRRVLHGTLRRLGESPARLVLVNLEDLWLEERPQNVPGTAGPENWTRKASLDLETFTPAPEVLEGLEALSRAREAARTEEGGDAS